MGLSKSAISRIVGVDISYKSFSKNGAQLLPQRLAVFGQTSAGVEFSPDKYESEGSAAEVAKRYGWGSPLHLVALQLYPETGTGCSVPVDFFPVATPANAVAATGRITVTGAATDGGSGKLYVGGKQCEFAIAKGDTGEAVMAAIKDAVNGVLEMPATAGEHYDRDC